MHDLIIIGGGPAGLTATLYALKKRLDVLLISLDLGGKINYQMELASPSATSVIRGNEVVERIWSDLDLLEHERRLERVVSIVKTEGEGHFVVATEADAHIEAKTVILATGARLRQLGVPGEREYIGKGLSYSAISYAPLFADREVAVIGDGDRALRAAVELAQLATRVHLVTRQAETSSNKLLDRLATSLKAVIWAGYEPVLIEGNDFVSRLIICDQDGHEVPLDVEGVFAELGIIPNSEPVSGLAHLDAAGHVIVDNRNRTSCPGLLAAGDVTDVCTEQVLVAVGEGAKAALGAFEHVLESL